MNKLKESFAKYGPWEWVAAVFGLLVTSRVVLQYLLGRFDHIGSWEQTSELIVPLGALAIGGLLLGAPMAVLDIFRKKAGLPTREEKIKNKNTTGN